MTVVTPRVRATALYVLVGAVSLSSLGLSASYVAVPWFVLQSTGSAAHTGVVIAVGAIAAGVGGIVSGPFVDRWGFRRTAVVSFCTSACGAAGFPIAYHAGVLNLPVLCLLAAVASVLDVPGGAAVSGLVARLADDAKVPLERGNALLGGARQVAQLLGPPLGGAAVALAGAGSVLIFDAAASVTAAAVIAFGVAGAAHRPDAQPRGRGYLAELLEGVRILGAPRVVRALTLSTIAFAGLESALSGVVLVTFAYRHLDGGAGFGTLLTCFGVGVLVGTLCFVAIGDRFRRGRTYLFSSLTVGLLILPFAVLPPLPVSAALMALLGVVSAPAEPLWLGAMQRHLPADRYGRAMTVVGTVTLAAVPVATVAALVLVEWFGLRPAFLVLAAVYLTITAGCWASPELRRM